MCKKSYQVYLDILTFPLIFHTKGLFRNILYILFHNLKGLSIKIDYNIVTLYLTIYNQFSIITFIVCENSMVSVDWLKTVNSLQQLTNQFLDVLKTVKNNRLIYIYI